VRAPELAIERLTELRRLGLRVALDDFRHRREPSRPPLPLPRGHSQIDGSVVKDAATNCDHEAVITAAVALARSRRLKVVAEGVETEAQRVHLVRWQCDRMQGNLAGRRPPRPIPRAFSCANGARPASPRRTGRGGCSEPGRRRDSPCRRGYWYAWRGAGELQGDGAGGALPAGEAGWYLETLAEGGTLRRVRIHALPFRIGRRQGLDMVLPRTPSRRSTRRSTPPAPPFGCATSAAGTAPSEPGPRRGRRARRGDILHFADFEFRLAARGGGLAPGRGRGGWGDHDRGQEGIYLTAWRRGHASCASFSTAGW